MSAGWGRGRHADLCTLLLFLTGASVAAQEAAVVIYAEGDFMTVVGSNGQETMVDAADALGFELKVGDTIATEHGTFVEIQLLPSDSIVKVAENTNFTIERRDSPRGGTFNLVYGKVRARVALLTQREEFVIRSGTAAAGVRGTDFGVSVVVPGRTATELPAPEELEKTPAVTQVYCFDGEIEVVALPSAAAPETPLPPPVLLRENQVVTVEPDATEALVARTIPEDIRTYWEANDFRAQPLPVSEEMRPTELEPSRATPLEPERSVEPEPAGPEVAPVAAAEPAPQIVTPPEVLIQRAETGRLRFRAISVLMFTVGAAFEAAGLIDALAPGTDIFGDNGIGLIGVGAVFLVGGVFSTFQAARLDQTLSDLKQRQAP